MNNNKNNRRKQEREKKKQTNKKIFRQLNEILFQKLISHFICLIVVILILHSQ